MTTADRPYPRRRIVNVRAGIAKVDAEGRCRICGRPGRWPVMNRHHILARVQGGDDVDANIVPLCGSGSSGCHGRVTTQARARSELRGRLTASEIDYVRTRTADQGRPGWIDIHYPAADTIGGTPPKEMGLSDGSSSSPSSRSSPR